MKSLIILIVCAITIESLSAQLYISDVGLKESLDGVLALLDGSYVKLVEISIDLGRIGSSDLSVQTINEARTIIQTSTTKLRSSTIAQIIAKPAQFIQVKIATNLVNESVSALASDVVNNVNNVPGLVDAVADNATNLADTVTTYLLASLAG